MSHDFSTVREYALKKGGRLFVAPTSTKDLVVVQGSVFGGPTLMPREQDVLPVLAAMLLDAGTGKKNKSVVRDALAVRGISLSFGAVGNRTLFSGQCFPEDLSILLSAIVECLTQASFPEVEVKNAKALALGALAEEKSDTRALAGRALVELLYDSTHPNYARTVSEEEKSVASLRRVDFKKFQKQLGRGGLVLVIAGDVDVRKTYSLAEKACAKLGKGTATTLPVSANTKAPHGTQKIMSVPDKANVDVCLGVGVPVTLSHVLYHPLKVLVEMLGGGSFGSHLMKTIRERDGLTYGVYARLVGLHTDTDGYLKIWASFTPARYAESVTKLRTEINVFFREGISTQAFEQAQARMIGSYAVSLATTSSLAGALHAIGTESLPLAYLAEYPDIIRKVTFGELKQAAALIQLDKFSLVAAGTFPKK